MWEAPVFGRGLSENEGGVYLATFNNTDNATKSQAPFSAEVPELLQKHLDHLKASAISLEVIRESVGTGQCSAKRPSRRLASVHNSEEPQVF